MCTFEKKTIALWRRMIDPFSKNSFVFKSSFRVVLFSNENHWQISYRRGVLQNAMGKSFII